MRRILAQIETLGSARFIVLVGAVAGAIQGVPRLFVGGSNVAHQQFIIFLVIGISAVLWWTGALLLWWIAVRRRQSSLWTIAAHVSLGWIIADMLANAIGMVGAFIDTHGEYAAAIAQHLPMVIVSNVSIALLRSPLWFFGSALAIVLGRHLIVAPPPFSACASTDTDPGAVT